MASLADGAAGGRRTSSRRLLLAVLGVVLVLAFVVLTQPVTPNRAADECQKTPPGREPPGTGVRTRWEWLPPGYVCVYTDRDGRVLEERRP